MSEGENQTVKRNVPESFSRTSMSLSLSPSILAASHKAKECVCVLRKKRSKESNTDLSHCQGKKSPLNVRLTA